MSKNLQIVQDIYAAVGRGDIPAVIEAMTEDVEIVFPGPTELPFAGSFTGADGVAQFFQAIGENCEVNALEPQEFIADGNTVVVLGHENVTAKPTGRSWDTDFAMVWTIDDGRVSRLREYHQTDAMVAAFH